MKGNVRLSPVHTLEVACSPTSAIIDQKAPPALTVLSINGCALVETDRLRVGLDLHFITEIQDKAAGDSL